MSGWPGSPGGRAVVHGAIDLRALTLAAAVAECGSIRLAARRTGLGPSAVSRRIHALEEALGVSLFERRSAGMRPTEAGTRFLAAARRLLLELESASGHAREAGRGAVGHLVVGSYFSASVGRFRDSVVRFVQRHRRVVLRLMEGTRAELLAAIQAGEADLAVLMGPGDEHGLDRLALWDETVLVALNGAHPLAEAGTIRWRQLASETFVVTRRGSGPEARAKVEALLPRGHMARFAEHDVSREAMFNLVGAGLGVAVLAESSSGASYPGVVFRPVGDEYGPTMIEAVAYWDPKRDNPALRRFLALLRAAQEPGSPDTGAV